MKYGISDGNSIVYPYLYKTFILKNKLLRSAYGEQAEYNQSLFKLDDLFDNDKELEELTKMEKNLKKKLILTILI